MRIATLQLATVLLALTFTANGDIPDQYQGKPFYDATSGPNPQVIPGRCKPRFMIAACGEIKFPHAGRQLLTFHYKKGNNFAYFDFVPAD